MSEFEAVIGLEVHVQLNTRSKIFCSCPTSFGASANANTCPVCLALPGALPVLNKEALKKAISFGVAIDARINERSIFARKNYFYPDLPKAYQISQFEVPIVGLGHLDIHVDEDKKSGVRNGGAIAKSGSYDKRIGITRAHLEEDAGKNIHKDSFSEVDLNRAGTPLLEIVSEPDMRSSDEAIAYLKKLHKIVRFIDISDANMQEGNFRCDANISIREAGSEVLNTRVEVKNLNSFRFINKAIDYEIARQIEAYKNGSYEKEVVQETRLFDTIKGETRSMRGKEGSADYRYFKDPDLLTLMLDEALLQEGSKIPELPEAKSARYKDLGLNGEEIDALLQSPSVASYFEAVLEAGIKAKLASSFVGMELLGLLKEGMGVEDCALLSSDMAYLLGLIEADKISSKSAKAILKEIVEGSPNGENIAKIDAIITRDNLLQVDNTEELLAAIEALLDKEEQKVAQYLDGKDKLFGFFVGQMLKGMKNVSPKAVNTLLRERLEARRG